MFFLKRLIERIITLAIFSTIGAVVMGAAYDGKEDAVLSGAFMGAGVVLVYWLLGGIFRALFRRVSKAQLATIVDISNEAPPGAPWYHHAYVLFDIKGKRRKLKLTPEQARYFANHYSTNDTGRLKWTGGDLIEFELPTPVRPLRSTTKSGPKPKVFISYAHEDDPQGQTADYLEQVFRSGGLDTWVDKNELAPGDKLKKEIEQWICNADYFVPILTPIYMSSSWCLREFELAAESNVTIIPIKTTPDRLVTPPDMRNLFEEKAGEPKYLDLSSHGYLDELRALVDQMAGK